MKPVSFQYHTPGTVEDAVALLSRLAPDDGRILAGGQSLVPTMAFRLARPGHLIDINGIDALNRIATEGDALVIGACTRHAAFHETVCEGPLGQMLSTVADNIAHYPIRVRGTFCGSLAHADPSSEWCLVAATLDATMKAVSARGERLIAAVDFLETVMTTALEEDELLVEVRLPILSDDTRFGFIEFSRRVGDFAMAAALVTYRVEDGVITDPHIGIGGAEDRARRIGEAEQALIGKPPGKAAFADAANATANAVDPMQDINTSAEYRRDLVRTLTRRALERAAQ